VIGCYIRFLVLEEEGNFCLISTLVAAAMAEKITYKKRKTGCTAD
jgi:hypothetical protein